MTTEDQVTVRGLSTDDNPALTLHIDDDGELIVSVDHRNKGVFRGNDPRFRKVADSPIENTNVLRVVSYTVLVYGELDKDGKPGHRYFGAIVNNRKYC